MRNKKIQIPAFTENLLTDIVFTASSVRCVIKVLVILYDMLPLTHETGTFERQFIVLFFSLLDH